MRTTSIPLKDKIRFKYENEGFQTISYLRMSDLMVSTTPFPNPNDSVRRIKVLSKETLEEMEVGKYYLGELFYKGYDSDVTVLRTKEDPNQTSTRVTTNLADSDVGELSGVEDLDNGKKYFCKLPYKEGEPALDASEIKTCITFRAPLLVLHKSSKVADINDSDGEIIYLRRGDILTLEEFFSILDGPKLSTRYEPSDLKDKLKLGHLYKADIEIKLGNLVISNYEEIGGPEDKTNLDCSVLNNDYRKAKK